MPRRTGNGYALGMNRDEQRSRVKALPPKIVSSKGLRAIYPSEPSGGTWIGANESRISFALINWYSVQRKVTGKTESRGLIIPDLLRHQDSASVKSAVLKHDFSRTNPFRLIGIFPKEKLVLEWCWNLQKLYHISHPWKLSTWISSGHDEPGAQKTRHAEFLRRTRQTSRGTLDWMRRFHRSHLPERGPYSVCMHRDDAVTVSYTEALVSNTSVTMNYLLDSPCSNVPWKKVCLKI